MHIKIWFLKYKKKKIYVKFIFERAIEKDEKTKRNNDDRQTLVDWSCPTTIHTILVKRLVNLRQETKILANFDQLKLYLGRLNLHTIR